MQGLGHDPAHAPRSAENFRSLRAIAERSSTDHDARDGEPSSSPRDALSGSPPDREVTPVLISDGAYVFD
jgi:hypothetical protein